MQFITFKNLTVKGGDMCCHGIPYAEFDRTGMLSEIPWETSRTQSYKMYINIFNNLF